MVGEALKALLQREGLIDPLTRVTGSLSQTWAFVVSFVALLAVLAAILRRQRPHRSRGAERVTA